MRIPRKTSPKKTMPRRQPRLLETAADRCARAGRWSSGSQEVGEHFHAMRNEDIAHGLGDGKSRPGFTVLGDRLADLLIELDVADVPAEEVTSRAAQLIRALHDVGRREPASRFAKLGGDATRERASFGRQLRREKRDLKHNVELGISGIAFAEQELARNVHEGEILIGNRESADVRDECVAETA